MTKKAPGKSHRKGMSLVDIVRKFPTDEAAQLWFETLRWPGGVVSCPHCGSVNVQTGCKHKMPYRCREKECGRPRFSVRIRTVMEDSNLGFQTWAIAIFLFMTNLKSVSSMKLHRDLSITQKSAWHLAHRIRKALDASQPLFSGPVEVDETYVGGKRKNMSKTKRETLAGRGAVGKVTVVGVKDRATNRVLAEVIASNDATTLQGFIGRHTGEETMVYTDEHGGYRGLPNHETVTHSVGEYVRGQAHTNGIESFWSMLKRGYQGTFHHFSEKHTGRYVSEFAGRHNLREMDTVDQMSAMAQGMVGKRLRYRELIV